MGKTDNFYQGHISLHLCNMYAILTWALQICRLIKRNSLHLQLVRALQSAIEPSDKYSIRKKNSIKNGTIIFVIDSGDWDVNTIEVNRYMIIDRGAFV